MKILKHLFSGWLMGILLIVFAFVIGYATFVENDYGANASKLLIYNTRWFELILFLMVVNFSGMIFTKKLYLKGKLNTLLIHLALVIIIIGAGVTRYVGREGMMHIRNGEVTNAYLSSDTYLTLELSKGDKSFKAQERVILSSVKKNLFSDSYKFEGDKYKVQLEGYYQNSEKVALPDESGDAYVHIVMGGTEGRQDVFIKEGESRYFEKFGIVFGDTNLREMLCIIRNGDDMLVRFPGEWTEFSAPRPTPFQPLKPMTMLKMADVNFVVKAMIPHARLEYKLSETVTGGMPVVKVLLNDDELILPVGLENSFDFDDVHVGVYIGAIPLELPFMIRLDQFKLDRYPGSMSPSSYESEVTVLDAENSVEMPFSIYMNHILNYGGYRFFQSSYDDDEQGTVLSVNQDYWGTFITYLGYFLLFSSLIISIFSKTSRFGRVSMLLKDIHNKRKKIRAGLTIALLLISSSVFSQTPKIDAEHAAKFGNLLVQNHEGRIEPVNTMANKVVVKFSKKSAYNGMNADQVFLSILLEPETWKDEVIIKVINEDILKLIGAEGPNASFNDFIGDKGSYKLFREVEKANLKKPSERNTFDKDLISVDERVNVFYMLVNASTLKMFPMENDPSNSWRTPSAFHNEKGHGNEDADLFESYLISLGDAVATNNYKLADIHLSAIHDYQQELGADIIPSESTVKLEVMYNNFNVFKKLFPYYFMLGLVLIVLFFVQTFMPKYEFKTLTNIFYWILLLAFVLHTLGLIVRWYISGHAPWSNGYESMIYISWATMLAGFVFMSKSPVTLGVTSLISGIALLTAHMSYLNPEVTNLVPVLKSYWLTIHVATITASYGFLALGCVLAFLNLLMIIFRTEKNAERVSLTMRELMLIIEMSISVGLVLIVIGNFLGAIWANESWGRYWGWDPKETWTLVTIMLYTFTLHLTIIPSVRNTFSFSFMAFISFGAVLMTYFGVNFYLSGLHSYAAGDPIPIPVGLYYALIVVAAVSFLAYYHERRFRKLNEDTD